jgi:DNA-binding NarL/FixJ family response regulator
MDDEEPIRLMTKTLLERLGLEATMTCEGGEAVREYAIAQVDGRKYDLVIMDLTVPGAMSGADAMREILKIDPSARGIVSSGYHSDPVMANYRAYGFRGMVPKPYRLSDFARAIREVMQSN